MSQVLGQINAELAKAALMFKQGRKKDAALLYVSCGEALQKLQSETQDDPLFVESLKARVQDCVRKAEICQTGKPQTEAEPPMKTLVPPLNRQTIARVGSP